MCFTTMEAELDNVTGRRDIIDERSYAQLSELQSNAKGVLFLLLSAESYGRKPVLALGGLLAGSTGELTRVAANDMAPAPSIMQ